MDVGSPVLVRACAGGQNPLPNLLVAPQVTAVVVEDDASTREFLVRALAKGGVATVEARTVGRALAMLEQDTLPSVVVLELGMPDANGAILLRRIRRDRLPMRVAIVTGVPDPVGLPRCLPRNSRS